MPIVSFCGVWHAYAAGTPFQAVSLADLSLDVYKGELVALVGPSGSGKSTALQLMNGLLLPDRGRVLINGLDTGNKKYRKNLWRVVGLVMQQPERQLFEETVLREVSFGPANLGLPAQEISRRAESALAMVGLGTDIFSLSPFNLSGGEQRRVALASVLAIEPEVLVLDEPTAGIDPAGRRIIIEVLKNLKKAGGTTIIMASHNMDDVAEAADRVIVLQSGRAVLTAETGEAFKNYGVFRDAGLELPFTIEVIARLNEAGFNIESTPLTLDAAADVICREIRARQQEGG